MERNPLRSYVFIVPEDCEKEIDPNDIRWATDDEEIPNRLTKWLNGQVFVVEPQIGDTVQLSWRGHRNDGTYFIDIINDEMLVIDMNNENDEYGSVPEKWKFPEFPIDYFLHVVRHNQIVYLDEQFDEEIKTNLTFGKPPVDCIHIDKEINSKSVYYSFFDYHQTYWIIYTCDDYDPNGDEPFNQDSNMFMERIYKEKWLQNHRCFDFDCYEIILTAD